MNPHSSKKGMSVDDLLGGGFMDDTDADDDDDDDENDRVCAIHFGTVPLIKPR